jgi:hypothetical protein
MTSGTPAGRWMMPLMVEEQALYSLRLRWVIQPRTPYHPHSRGIASRHQLISHAEDIVWEGDWANGLSYRTT